MKALGDSILDRRFFFAAAAALSATHLLRARAYAQPAKKKPSSKLLDKQTRGAIDRGLSFLADRQNADGSMGRSYGQNVGVCSLAGMAWMASGHMPGRGRYGKAVSQAIAFVLEHAQPSGFISSQLGASHGPMYGHGFATLFLAEAYGMSPNRDIRDKLSSAVKLIVGTQNKEGGWRYHPQRRDADISVTICQVMALRAARNAGIFVPNETIDRCTDFVKRCQNADGGFMYMLAQPGDSRFPRSAAGVVALYSAGIYEGEEIEKGLKYLEQFEATGGTAASGHFYYGHYYAVQAMWHTGGKQFEKWYRAISKYLLARQRDSGAWLDEIGVEYATAMASIILQMPNNYLPIFQR